MVRHTPWSGHMFEIDKREEADIQQPPYAKSFAVRWGEGVARHRRIVIVCWLVLLIVCSVLAPSLRGRLSSPNLGADHSQSTQANDLINQHFSYRGNEQEVLVFESAERTVGDPVFRQVVNDAIGVVKGTPGVLTVISPYDTTANHQISGDRRTALALISVRGNPLELKRLSDDLQAKVDATSRDTIRVVLTGYSPLVRDVSKLGISDVSRAESISVPIALIMLVVATGSVVGAMIPLICALAALLTAYGVLFVLSFQTSFDTNIVAVATMLGTGVGIDYALFVVSRFREELASDQKRTPVASQAVIRATGVAIGTAGKTIAASGLIVLVSLTSVVVIPAPIFREIAVGITATVGSAVVVGLTLLPAVLAAIGTRVNVGALTSRWQPPSVNSQGEATSRWAAWARRVMSRPIVFAAAVTAVLVLAAIPITGIRYGIDIGTRAASDTPAGQGLNILAAKFSPGMLAPISIVATGANNGPLSADAMAATGRFVDEISKDTAISTVSSEIHDDRALITVVPSVSVDSTAATDLVNHLRDQARRYQSPAGLQLSIGGVSASFIDLSHAIAGKTVLVVSLVLVMSFVFLLFVFRSVVLPAKAILMNLLSTGAALGITVAVFQWGWGAKALDFTNPGFLQVYLPIAVFCLVFGLSMDYEVFLIRRIKERWDKTGNNEDAVAVGIEHTGRAITAAAAIMVAIFCSFLGAEILELKQFGLALAVAVGVDAVLIRMILVPALMRLLGRWNWWLPFQTNAKRSPVEHGTDTELPTQPHRTST